MINKLDTIVAQKQKEVFDLYQKLFQRPEHPIAKMLSGEFHGKNKQKVISFKSALQSRALAVIAEIKRASPSKGALAAIKDPIKLAEHYIAGGASAISVLTDETFFNGGLQDLIQVSDYAAGYNVPVLRKDFIIDPIQIAEAVFGGASAVLLIVAILGEKTKSLLDFANALQLDVLVEVHDEEELEIALTSGAEIIGINNRNLKTFMVDTEYALTLNEKIPDHIIKVAESGITAPSLAKRYHDAGFNAVLIGETLVKSDDPKQFIEACRHG